MTLVTQNLSEFALHIRAVLGFPIPEITLISPGASRPLKAQDELSEYSIVGVEQALALPNTQVRLFGKPVTKAGRRVAVALSSADSIELARVNAARALECLVVEK